ncbi:leucine-rich repeat domain-containing protein [Gimesia panareensis]|uniref:leucine-rich repeat domain-containing protein n=1 Tax=Gimesia panareensis TaxID=2527978 RepID=UPI00118CAB43|nr:hypothetical protein [Gimesia panareensis]QDU51309.1 Leucine Rich repeats (2 copies) [Gimesia panareensis]
MAQYRKLILFLILGQNFLISIHLVKAQSNLKSPPVTSEDPSLLSIPVTVSGESHFTLDLKNATVKQLAVAGNGKVVAFTSGNRRLTVILVSAKSQTAPLSLDREPLMLALTPDGLRCALGYSDAIEIINLTTRKKEHTLKVDLSPGDILKFSPDGSALFWAGEGHLFRYEKTQGYPEKKLCDFDTPVRNLTFSPNSRRVATSHAGNVVHIRDAQTGNSLRNWNIVDLIQGLGYSADGKELNLLVQGNAQIWDAQNGMLLRKVKLKQRMFMHPDTPPWGTGGADDRSYSSVEKIPGKRRIQIQFQFHTNPIHAQVASSDGQLLTLRTRDGKTTVAPVSSILGQKREQIQAELESLGVYVSHYSSSFRIYTNSLDTRIATLINQLNPLGEVTELTIRGRMIDPEALSMLFRGAGISELTLNHAPPQTLEALSRNDKLTQLYLRDTDLQDESLAPLAALTSLRVVSLTGAEFTGSGLKYLKNSAGMTRLSLSSTGITDANMPHLKVFTQLHSLDLSQTKITDAGLDSIQNLHRLNRLSLGYTSVTGAGLTNLANMHELQELRLQKTRITEAGLEALRQLKNLRQLDLSSASLSAKAARQLAGCQNLQYLTLNHADLTDDTLAALDNLPNLDCQIWKPSI